MRTPKKGSLPTAGDPGETLSAALGEADSAPRAAGPRPSRRTFLKGTMAASAALLATRLTPNAAQAADDQGVASGNPRPDSVILWTRVPEGFQGASAVRVYWSVSTSETFTAASIVSSGDVTTSAATDFTVRVRASGLSPFTTYYYRFTSDTGYQSVTGRTLTAPHEAAFPDEIRLAFISCNNFNGASWNALDALTQDDLHYCAHVGDNVYEGSLGRTLSTVADYRALHRYYLTKPELREARRLFPWIHTWDDHELFNNYAGNDLEDSQRSRQAAAYTAFNEYMPLDPEIQPTVSGNITELKIFRQLSFGRLFDVFATDGRQYRDGFVCGREALVGPCDALYDADRSMLGREQTDWLKGALDASQARWKLVLNGTIMMAMKLTNDLVPVFRRVGWENTRETSEGLVINLDQWDGFPENRREILTWVGDRGIDNLIVLTGDVHNCFAGQLEDDYSHKRRGRKVGVEIVTGSITSDGIGEALMGYDASDIAYRALQPANPHIDFVDAYYHVYTRLHIRPEQVRATYIAVDTIESAEYEAFELANLTVPQGDPVVIVED